MTSDSSAKAYIEDAVIILEEARLSFDRRHFHRVVRKCQEATELVVKGLFRYFGIEYPKVHIIGRTIKKEIGRLNIFSREELDKIAYFSDRLAFDREPSFYGSIEGIPASELFDDSDAVEAIENAEWVIDTVKKFIVDK